MALNINYGNPLCYTNDKTLVLKQAFLHRQECVRRRLSGRDTEVTGPGNGARGIKFSRGPVPRASRGAGRAGGPRGGAQRPEARPQRRGIARGPARKGGESP